MRGLSVTLTVDALAYGGQMMELVGLLLLRDVMMRKNRDLGRTDE